MMQNRKFERFTCKKSRAEPPTGNAALYKGRSLSSLKASPAWYALQVGERETVSNIHPNALLREAGWIC
nr:MAG TPA: hypothetical protein [Caudoviricetes sp.]